MSVSLQDNCFRKEYINYLCKKDTRLAKVIKMVGNLRYDLVVDGYSFLVRVIIEQMLSAKVGKIIYLRLEKKCEGKVTSQSISNLSNENIREIGTSLAKVQYIRNLTEEITSKNLDLEQLKTMCDNDVCKKLMSIKGIGIWTAKMYLIFVLGRLDVLPYEDSAFLQSYKWIYKTNLVNTKDVIKKCKKWKPYSSIAARYLYKALDNGLTKKELDLY